MTTSTDYDTKWGGTQGSGADAYATGKWLNIDNFTPYQIVSRSTETSQLGSEQFLRFGAEIGTDKFQPTGTYRVDVTMTATTL